jgi:hypothetical protein
VINTTWLSRRSKPDSKKFGRFGTNIERQLVEKSAHKLAAFDRVWYAFTNKLLLYMREGNNLPFSQCKGLHRIITVQTCHSYHQKNKEKNSTECPKNCNFACQSDEYLQANVSHRKIKVEYMLEANIGALNV